MRRDIYEAVIPLDFHALLNDLAQTTRAVSGWVDCSLSCASNIMRAEAVRVSSLSLSEWRDQIERLIPGYYWRQLLTEQHIRILGGISKIKREAPCADVEETDIDGKPAVWLRLNDNPYTTTPEERLKLKEYLWPLLPPVNYSALMFEMKDKRVLDLTVLTNDEKRIIDEL